MLNINPIIKTDYPDPDVIRVGDTYYMISTTMYFLPGGVILRSYDLVNWEIASYVFDKLENPSSCVMTDDESFYGKGMWAASLRYHKGRFYVAFVSHGQECTHLYISENIDGPWEHRRINEYFHDCSLLFDEDKVYIVSGNTNIRLCELSEDLTTVKEGGIDKIIIQDDRNIAALGYEGSHFYKINGKYFVSLIHWPKGGVRTQAVFVSDFVDGPYVGKDVLSDVMGQNGRGVAQGGFVDTPDGKWYSILFQDSGAVGRIPVLVEVDFNNDFPIFGEEGAINLNPKVKSNKDTYTYEPLYTSDDFTYDEGKAGLKKQWQWNHEPVNTLWDIEKDKGLCIQTGRLSANPIWAVNTLTQRMMMPSSMASVCINATELMNGDYAGLLALQGCYGLIGVTKENDKVYLINLVNRSVEFPMKIGYVDKNPPKEVYRQEISCSKIKVSIKAEFSLENDQVEFFANIDGKTIKIGDCLKMSFGLDHFTGARFGLCVYSTKQVGGKAYFSNFIYSYE